MARGDIVAEPGTSKDSKDGYGSYLRLYRTGPRRTGTVAYFRPSSGVVDVRLPKESAEARTNVQVRYPDRDDEYNIRVRIDSSKSVDLAIELLDETIRANRLVTRGEPTVRRSRPLFESFRMSGRSWSPTFEPDAELLPPLSLGVLGGKAGGVVVRP